MSRRQYEPPVPIVNIGGNYDQKDPVNIIQNGILQPIIRKLSPEARAEWYGNINLESAADIKLACMSGIINCPNEKDREAFIELARNADAHFGAVCDLGAKEIWAVWKASEFAAFCPVAHEDKLFNALIDGVTLRNDGTYNEYTGTWYDATYYTCPWFVCQNMSPLLNAAQNYCMETCKKDPTQIEALSPLYEACGKGLDEIKAGTFELHLQQVECTRVENAIQWLTQQSFDDQCPYDGYEAFLNEMRATLTRDMTILNRYHDCTPHEVYQAAISAANVVAGNVHDAGHFAAHHQFMKYIDALQEAADNTTPSETVGTSPLINADGSIDVTSLDEYPEEYAL